MELKLTAFSQHNSGVLRNYERKQAKIVVEKVEPSTDSTPTTTEPPREAIMPKLQTSKKEIT